MDRAGHSLFNAFQAEVERQLAAHNVNDEVDVSVSSSTMSNYQPVLDSNRVPIDGGGGQFDFGIASKAPARAAVTLRFHLEVPKDAGKEDDVVIWSMDTKERFNARMGELVPTLSVALQMRLSMFVQKLLGDALTRLVTRAQKAIQNQGYAQ